MNLPNGITESEFKRVCLSAQSMRQASFKLGMDYKVLRKYAKLLNCFVPNQKCKGISKPRAEGTNGKFKLNDILNGKHPTYHTLKLKHRLIKTGLKDNRCERCDLTSWMNSEISLELHHKDGNNRNHTLDNLELLCPNCHSQTETFRKRKKIKA